MKQVHNFYSQNRYIDNKFKNKKCEGKFKIKSKKLESLQEKIEPIFNSKMTCKKNRHQKRSMAEMLQRKGNIATYS